MSRPPSSNPPDSPIPRWLLEPLAAGIFSLQEADQLLQLNLEAQRQNLEQWDPPPELLDLCNRLNLWEALSPSSLRH